MYTLQDYVVAIKRHYGRSKYRKLVSLYGIPYREIDTNSLPKRSASLAFKLNTRDQTFNRTSINIEVDSPTVVRVQVIKRSIWFIELIQRWYYFHYLHMDCDTYRELQAKQLYSVIYFNPTVEFVVAQLPKDYCINLKLLYAWLFHRISGAHKRHRLLHKATSRYILLRRWSGWQLYTTYRHYTEWYTWKRIFMRLIVQYIPGLYITSFTVLLWLIVRYYGKHSWLMVCLRGGFYGGELSFFDTEYILDTGFRKIKFMQIKKEYWPGEDSIISWYEGDNFCSGVKLTYWGLWRLLRELKRD